MLDFCNTSLPSHNGTTTADTASPSFVQMRALLFRGLSLGALPWDAIYRSRVEALLHQWSYMSRRGLIHSDSNIFVKNDFRMFGHTCMKEPLLTILAGLHYVSKVLSFLA